MPRLILDTSTIARWTGPPVGIVRVEHELARHAMANRPDVVLAYYDPLIGELRELSPRWRHVLLGLDGAIDTIALEYRSGRSAWRKILPSRYPIVMALERLRLLGPARLAPLIEKIQRPLLGGDGLRPPFGDVRGRRHAVVPYAEAFGPPLSVSPNDTVLSAGTDWLHKGSALRDLARREGCRLAVVCYDLLPLTHPEFFPTAEIPRFRDYWLAILPDAARVLCNAHCIAADIVAFAAANGLPAPAPVVIPLGHAPPYAGPLPPLRAPLRPGGFALFVSTIEPRKGHAVLLDAWRVLMAAGVPRAHDFRLVFVGRTGWMVDDVLDRLKAPEFRDSVSHLEGIDDAELARLYRDAAFCVYPSHYEGFGLPIIEAFAHGKAVLASTGGAVPETASGLAPCLDPSDVRAWEVALTDWITRPEAVAEWESRVKSEFRFANWPDAAEGIMRAALTDA